MTSSHAHCPVCGEGAVLQQVQATEAFNVRGEEIAVTSNVMQCPQCGEAMLRPEDPDPLDLAYREYRKRHGLLQPEEIRELRNRYQLTQGELSTLLGLGGATLSRWENGALQEEAHDKLLRFATEPYNLRRLLLEKPEIIPQLKRDQLLRQLDEEEASWFFAHSQFQWREQHSRPNEYTGFRPFSFARTAALIRRLCDGGQLKTKLNKLLFYADFLHYKRHRTSITGLTYVHLQHGPVPDDFQQIFGEMERQRELISNEIDFGGGVIGEEYQTLDGASTPETVLSAEEIATTDYVANFFKGYTATRIRTYSHEETAYTKTDFRESISYKFADTLRIC